MANKAKHKVLVALTGQRLIFSRTAFSLINAAINAKTFEFDFYMEMGCEIASARNRMAQVARDRGATHILFVDYDMYFGPETIDKLLKQDKDIIGAHYNFRSGNEERKSTAIPLGKEVAAQEADLPKEPFKCEALGTGFLLIRVSVFDKFKAPWFMFGYTPEGTLHYGEDTFFCQRAIKEGGLDVWCDPTLSVKHIGEQLF